MLVNLADCCECPLYEGATNVVPGEGNPESDILFLGEGPGRQEDATGRPFVGPAGKVLNGVLRELRLRRSDVFITNLVRHRPPGNRVPIPSEIESCSHWLDEELVVVRPQLIVCLGNTAASRYFPDKAPLGSLRALSDRTIVVSTYHPAFFARARRPAVRQKIIDDIAEGMKVAGVDSPSP